MIVKSMKSCRLEKAVERKNIFTEENTDHYRKQIRNKMGDIHLVYIAGISCTGGLTVKKKAYSGMCRQIG